jgi:hypothetical protein
MSHAYSENPVNMFQKAEAAPEGGLVTLSTAWWMRCFDATGGRLQRQDSLIGWVFDGYLMGLLHSDQEHGQKRRNPFSMKANFSLMGI